MPDLIFRATHEPPTWWERLLAHPPVVMAAFSAVVGVLLALDWRGLHLTSITDGHDLGLAALGVGQIIGAGIVTRAALSGRAQLLDRRKQQALGWAILSTGWVVYAGLVLATGGPASSVIISVGLVVMGAVEIVGAAITVHRGRTLVRRAAAIEDGDDE